MNFDITSISNPELGKNLKHIIDHKTKPIGALGVLEELAFQIGMIQNTDHPELKNPTIITFAGDHGIAKKGEVNPYPQEVTAQMVYNFLNKGAAINVFCKQNNIALKIVDAGVNHDFKGISGLIDAKIDFGTKNYQSDPAMSVDQCIKAIATGGEIILETYNNGCNCVGFGEMGISNTSSASLLMAYFTQTTVKDCVGSGTGLANGAIETKANILSQVYQKYKPKSPIDALATYGGFEIAMITGAILKAAELGMTIIIDGFIVSAGLLAAHAIDPLVLDYCIFAHTSGEQGHEKMLDFLNKKPLISLGMRLGEGTGAAVAYPIIASAVTFLNNMASFESAQISSKD
ncbi:nicotinate-nucleotide--dimethylbenzimidazole phosphoribosyltransferase [Aquimarina sp. 2201CG5-10]|uniref:nicotinate-nucleotide--dimethylbenzimidazole phosphoribosyltransferase n=1 Tax=Aquimarina callyspongiae TaxID=3098150 RepID=UPI002AB4652B|nr:nicotinate-nucleotide--dimethylbenzimidazole phosphoribosyltransferase [Aquimarina sp. 2201CG5-10]MDY8138891.1 nicotinate-nucleotide--dimethylbenzimidazole phosphoribosyltransferase [Aquimarina sp. 2201CG5-10]